LTTDPRIDTYIAGFPTEVQAQLESVRAVIRRVLPGAEETISYGIPSFRSGGRTIVHFAGWKKHISLYPVPEVDADLERRLEPYRSGPGTLRFPLERPIPLELVERVVGLLQAQRAGAT
jgi:uncharacterized protein YdhG (YjbR/CyaY superfamily)